MQGLRLRLAQPYSKYGESADGSATQQVQAFQASQQKAGEKVGLGFDSGGFAVGGAYHEGVDPVPSHLGHAEFERSEPH